MTFKNQKMTSHAGHIQTEDSWQENKGPVPHCQAGRLALYDDRVDSSRLITL